MRRWWRGVVARVLGVTFPGTERMPGLDPGRSRTFLDRLSREAPWTLRRVLDLSVLLFLVSPPLTIRRLRPALLLSTPDLDRHANALAHHRSYLGRQVMAMIKTVGGMCWGADDDVRRSLQIEPYGPDPGTWRQS
jgi:hypothetical protein